ncbi:MAG: tetratricopeptide repeat protein [Methanobrevibacter sp.]|uniref:tetratricopeptide repeat protein n=1 Tax=Methanobrevibacter sp. TaxID=66852 RepID=UPI0025EC7B94|nr:tetratricopeptide repeat protein [Methanobrevibacter sp.]MBR0271179.1 tetratricopeptide repeat protein [Methanobrevibacter sp.]
MAQIEQEAINLNNRGVELSQIGNFKEALECFSQAHNLVPDDPTIKNNIQLCLDALESE